MLAALRCCLPRSLARASAMAEHVKKRARLDGTRRSSSSGAAGGADPPAFLLTHIAGLSSQFNGDYTTSLWDLLRLPGCKMTSSVQFNFMFDLPWLISQYPAPTRGNPLVIVHGEKTSQARTALMGQISMSEHPGVRFFTAPNLDQWGSHHTKMMFLFYERGMRVVVHTANMIPRDWGKKTQGVWVSPLLLETGSGAAATGGGGSGFKQDLLAYLETYGQSPIMQKLRAKVATFDMSTVKVRFVGSSPGRHRGAALHHFGHMKLRAHLGHSMPPAGKGQEEIVCQFSSLGSLGKSKDTWVGGQFSRSLRTTSTAMTSGPVRWLYPTVANVRGSLEGYAAGSAIPNSAKTNEKQKWVEQGAHKWTAQWCGRQNAMPHIKTYMRINRRTSEVVWFLLTSSNLSKAAWGALEKNETQLHIRSYEAGVLFLPGDQGPGFRGFHLLGAGLERKREVSPEVIDLEADEVDCEPPAAAAAAPSAAGTAMGAGTLPVPYDYPLTPYAPDDKIWVWDVPHPAPDSFGRPWNP